MTKSVKIFLFTIFYLLFSIYSLSPVWAAQCSSLIDAPEFGCLEDYIQGIIRFIYPIAVAVTLFFLMWGGIKFIRSGGEPKAAEEAKKTMTYALGGLAVIFLIWFIFLVIEEMTGVDLTQFKIVGP